MRLLSVSALYRAVVLTWLLRGGNGVSDEDGKRIEALYTLTINLSDGQEKVFRIYDEKQEVADAVDEFVRLQSLGREHQERMVDHLCEQEQLLCTRRSPRKLLFDFSIYDDTGTQYYIHFYDQGDTPKSVAARACASIKTCRRSSMQEEAILTEVETRLRSHYNRDLASDCLYTRLGLGMASPRALTTTPDVRRAFVTRSRVYHPDKPGGDASAFVRLQEAYLTLSSADKRQAYDHRNEALETHLPKAQPTHESGAPVFEAFAAAFGASVETDGLNVRVYL